MIFIMKIKHRFKSIMTLKECEERPWSRDEALVYPQK